MAVKLFFERERRRVHFGEGEVLPLRGRNDGATRREHGQNWDTEPEEARFALVTTD